MAEAELFDGVPNSRSLGGLPLKQGGTTKDGVFYRTAALNQLSKKGRKQLEDASIGVIADLRTEIEKITAPDRVPEYPHLTRVKQIPIETGNLSPVAFAKQVEAAKKGGQAALDKLSETVPSLAEMYIQMISTSAKQLAKVAALVSEVEEGKNNAVVVHCTAGKDRTGISVALILDVVGVERDAIVQNYAVSQDYLAGPWADGMLGKLKKAGVPMVPKIVDMVTTTPPEAIEGVFKWIDENYGSTEEYLMSGGLTAAQLENLRLALT